MYIYLNVCSSIIFEQMLRFSYFFLLESSSVYGGTIVKSVAIRQFKGCLSASLNIYLGCTSFSIDQLSQKLHTFFLEVTLVCKLKIMNAC